MDFSQTLPINVNVFNVFSFTETFFICPDLIEAFGPYPNAPYLPKCFLILPKT